MRNILIALTAFIAPVAYAASTPAPSYSATAVLNQFLTNLATQNPALQRDIALEQGNLEEVQGRITPPRQVGVSPVCGVFSYRPVTWGELSKEDRLQILKHPSLLSWINWYNAQNNLSVPSRIGTPLANAANSAVQSEGPMPRMPQQYNNFQSVHQPLNTQSMAYCNTQNQQIVPRWANAPQPTQMQYAQQMQMPQPTQYPQNFGYTIGTPQYTYPQPATLPQPMSGNPPIPQQVNPQAMMPQPYNQHISPQSVQPTMLIQPVQPAMLPQPANSAVAPVHSIEYTEILELKRQLEETCGLPSTHTTTMPQYSCQGAEPTLPKYQSTGINEEMGKYQINIPKGQLYSPDPLYFNLKPSK